MRAEDERPEARPPKSAILGSFLTICVDDAPGFASFGPNLGTMGFLPKREDGAHPHRVLPMIVSLEEVFDAEIKPVLRCAVQATVADPDAMREEIGYQLASRGFFAGEGGWFGYQTGSLDNAGRATIVKGQLGGSVVEIAYGEYKKDQNIFIMTVNVLR